MQVWRGSAMWTPTIIVRRADDSVDRASTGCCLWTCKPHGWLYSILGQCFSSKSTSNGPWARSSEMISSPLTICRITGLFNFHWLQSRWKDPPYRPVGGASRMLRGLMLRMKNVSSFLLFVKYLWRYLCIMKFRPTGSVINYCLSNAIHGTGQSINDLKRTSVRTSSLPITLGSDRSFCPIFLKFER